MQKTASPLTSKDGYLEKIAQLQKDIKHLELVLTNTVQAFKREYAFMEGDRVKLEREEYDLAAGKDIKQEYYLIIKTAYFNPKILQWEYTFSNISPNGKQSNGRCAVFHYKTDKITKI